MSAAQRPGRRLAAALVAATLSLLSAPAMPATAAGQAQVLQVPVKPEPDGTAVSLDATLRRPAGDGPHPAVILAHGLGGSKDDLTTRADRLTAEGFVVLTYTARGFGASGGRVHLDDPDYEVDDARRLIDLLATRSEVALDAAGDPRVAVAGGSYGGALALMAAGTDPRVDAVVSSITWNDLSTAFFPQAAEGVARPGPFAQLWASTFFTGVAAGDARPDASAGTPQTGVCGRFDPALCQTFLPALNSGQPTPELLDLLRRHSPAPTNAQVSAPTLLIQGQSDSLFGLGQSDATWHQLTEAGTPVAMRWTDGGHDAPSLSEPADEQATVTWLRHYLRDRPGQSRSGTAHTKAPQTTTATPLPVPAFSYAGLTPRGSQTPPIHTLAAYPGLGGNRSASADFATGTTRSLFSPPGARPAATLATPGLAATAAGGTQENAVADQFAYQLAAIPGASVAFDTRPLPQGRWVVGSPQVRLRVTSTAPDATLYASLWQVTAGSARIAHRLSAPVQIPTTAGEPSDVTVSLPAGAWTMSAGSTWRVLVTSTDNSSATPPDARRYTVEPLGGLRLPVVSGAETLGSGTDLESWGLLAALAAVVAGTGAVTLLRRRRPAPRPAHPSAEIADVAEGAEGAGDVVLAVDHLVKTYRDGHRAVDDVSFEVRRGQIVGLLGPNGAGKTTTLRMVMGLIRPSHGQVRVLGQTVHPGAPVLAEVGALVEGPGFLPHLTGRANLEAYWAATGRPRQDAHLQDALDVAALGGAVDRPVRSYSQGMRQRLGIAQAMLGLPDVLILDEPANGLDPPQIAAMRPVLRAYAATGRTVIVSSHLLAEVELTCTDVVVMDRGQVIVTGSVADLTAATDEHGRRRLEEVFLGVLSASHGDPAPGEGEAGGVGGAGENMDVDAVVDRLRQVRSR